MATKVKSSADDLYAADFVAWTQAQADALRARRFDELDLVNLIEEVEDLGGSRRDAARSNARVLMEHLLKLRHSPAEYPRGLWRATVREHRRRLQDRITPTLRRHLEAELERLYAMARNDAASALRDHGERQAADALPERCPFALGELLDENVLS